MFIQSLLPLPRPTSVNPLVLSSRSRDRGTRTGIGAMSASYQTSAKPRGRREGDNVDKPSSSRNSSHVSSKASRTTSRTLEDASTPRNSRPDSPTLFWQRNNASDPSKPGDSVVMSPKASTASVRTDRSAPTSAPSGNKTPTPSSPTGSARSAGAKRSLESVRGSSAPIGFGMDNLEKQGSSMVSQKPSSQSSGPKLSRPSSKGSGLSQTAVAQMQPKVSDASEEDTSSQTSRPRDPPSSKTSPELSSSKTSEVGDRKSTSASTSFQQPDAPPQTPPYQPPNTSTPAISPPQSPKLYQHGIYGAQPAPYPYGYPPNIPQNPNMPGGFYAGPFSPPPQHRDLPRSPSVINREEHQQLLEKVTNVLPDINRLLEHYQETQGQLSAKDLMVKQSELQRAEEIARLRLELDVKKEEYDKLIERLVGENYKYKLELEEKNARIEALEEAARGHQSMRDEVESMKTKHEEAMSAADAARLTKEDLLAEKLKLEKTIEDLHLTNAAKHEQHTREIEELHREHKMVLDATEKDHTKAASEHKVILSKVQLELANLITKHSHVKKDFEASRGTVLTLEQRLDTTVKDHEAALARHQAELEARAKEVEELQMQHRQQLESQLESLTSSRQQEIQALQESQDQKLKDMMGQHEANATKLAAAHQAQLSDIRGELDGQKDAFGKLQVEHEEMGRKHNELAGAMISWKKRHEEWQVENDKLNKLLDTLGNTRDSKSDES